MLALIAGQGQMPAALVAALPERPYICALSDFLPDGLEVDQSFRLEHLGTLIRDLQARGITELCLLGAIRRPQIDPSQIDAATLPLVPVIQQALSAGDDGALRAVITVFENAGLTLRAAHELAPTLLPPQGCPTQRQPEPAHIQDATRANAILAAMDAADIGQSCAVLNGQALALEGIFGTDWMLSSLTARPDQGGGVFFKAPKPGQDRRADLPVIGPTTPEGVAEAGLDGLIVEAGGVMVLNPEQVIAECDRLNLFLWIRPT